MNIHLSKLLPGKEAKAAPAGLALTGTGSRQFLRQFFQAWLSTADNNPLVKSAGTVNQMVARLTLQGPAGANRPAGAEALSGNRTVTFVRALQSAGSHSDVVATAIPAVTEELMIGATAPIKKIIPDPAKNSAVDQEPRLNCRIGAKIPVQVEKQVQVAIIHGKKPAVPEKAEIPTEALIGAVVAPAVETAGIAAVIRPQESTGTGARLLKMASAIDVRSRSKQTLENGPSTRNTGKPDQAATGAQPVKMASVIDVPSRSKQTFVTGSAARNADTADQAGVVAAPGRKNSTVPDFKKAVSLTPAAAGLRTTASDEVVSTGKSSNIRQSAVLQPVPVVRQSPAAGIPASGPGRTASDQILRPVAMQTEEKLAGVREPSAATKTVQPAPSAGKTSPPADPVKVLSQAQEAGDESAVSLPRTKISTINDRITGPEIQVSRGNPINSELKNVAKQLPEVPKTMVQSGLDMVSATTVKSAPAPQVAGVELSQSPVATISKKVNRKPAEEHQPAVQPAPAIPVKARTAARVEQAATAPRSVDAHSGDVGQFSLADDETADAGRRQQEQHEPGHRNPAAGPALATSATAAATTRIVDVAPAIAAPRLIEKISQTISDSVNGSTFRTSFRVDGGSLGKLDIEFVRESGRNQATITVETDEVRAVLQKLTGDIQENLLQRGIILSVLDVAVGYFQNRNASQPERTQRTGQRNQKNTAATADGEEAEIIQDRR
ncbi:MAG: hypothetical protein ABIA75_14525, partial [Candidatus Neomarinimicrobiota bacterium]